MSQILFVDDDPRLLEGLERLLGLEFEVATAAGGSEGLEYLAEHPECQVVVSDMRMPGMDGATFLAEVRLHHPDTMRVLLTGHSDVESAIAAVNNGQIFRFLTKPCEPAVIEAVLRDAVEMHRLRHVEQDLLERTLRAIVDMLTQVLSLVSPVAFGRTSHMAHYVSQMSEALQLDDAWQLDMAAHLSHLGCVALNPETVVRAHAMQPLTPEEIREYKTHTDVTFDLLAPIPRLEYVAAIIQHHQLEEGQLRLLTDTDPALAVRVQALRLALEIDRRVSAGTSLEEAIAAVRGGFSWIDPRLLRVLPRLTHHIAERTRVLAMHPKDLAPGMRLDEEIRTRTGMLLVPSGQTVTPAIIRLLQSFAGQGQIDALVRVELAA